MPHTNRSSHFGSAVNAKTGGESEAASLIDFTTPLPSPALFPSPSPPRAVAMIPPKPAPPFSALYASHGMPYNGLDASIVKEAELLAPTDEKTNPWSAQSQQRAAHRRTLWVVGLIALLIAGPSRLVRSAIAGGMVGWHFTKGGPQGVSNRKNLNDNISNSGGASPNTPTDGTNATAPPLLYIPGTAQIVRSNPSHPSQFEPDPRLFRSFFGLTYTPYHAQEPNCLATQLNVTEDVQQLSQLTTRLRLTGSACNQSQMVLQAIKDTNVHVGVYLGIEIGNDAAQIERQKQAVWAAIQEFNGHHVYGVVIGNSNILHAANQQQATRALINHVSDFKARLDDLHLNRTIPVGTAEDTSRISPQLVAGVDFIMANTQPFFSHIPSTQASTWITTTFQTQIQPKIPLQSTPQHPHFVAFATEIGWPTDTLSLSTPSNYGRAVPGVQGLQTLLDTFVCQANRKRMQYFFTSAYDEPWKAHLGGVEPYWGLFDSNKKLKNLSLPLCSIEHH
ncbi:BQ2448_2414 [Microbotryum intermedium]|uniref:glucan endo-1,3-beta-D-glucosidase n=1 Tax=Microbotryum intermedium TaxID=269621 RepID=A0A238FBW8_9BASI|nr:BQ2448_2414 [Microbotryum intermedium]